MNRSDLRSRLDRMPSNSKGAAVLMLAALLFTVQTTLIKLLGERLHVTQILFLRQIVMSAIVLPMIVRGFPGVLATQRPGLQMARVALAVTAMLCGFTAIIHMPLADATAIGFTKSFFVTIFAVFVLSEKVGRRRWTAVIVGFAGAYLMIDPGPQGVSFYGILALIGAGAAGMVMVIIRLLSRTETTMTILSWQALGVGGAMALPAIYYWQWPGAAEWALIGLMGVFAYLAQYANISAYRLGEASLMATLDYVRLLYATLLGWLVFASLPGLDTWIGALVIVGASVYTVWREHRVHQRLTRSPEGRGYNH